MKPSEKADSGLNRRDLLKSGTAAMALTAGVGIPGLTVAAEASSANPIVKENAKPGTRDWMLTKTDVVMNEPVELWRSSRIEGYCSATSIRCTTTTIMDTQGTRRGGSGAPMPPTPAG